MCGLVGFVGGPVAAPEALAAQVRDMAATLSHRGPDDAGVWVDAEARPPGPYGKRLRALGLRWEPAPMERRSLHPGRELALVRGCAG